MGVSRRTVYRWLAAKDIPEPVATLLEQLKNGPIFKYGIWRGGSMVRYEWRGRITLPGKMSR